MMNIAAHGKHRSARIVSVLLLFLAVYATFPAASRAASISFGPYFYYAAWEPFYRDNLLSKNNDQSYTWNHKFTMKAAPLYGFTLGFSFADRWSLSAVFAMGRYVSKFSYYASSYLAPRRTSPSPWGPGTSISISWGRMPAVSRSREKRTITTAGPSLPSSPLSSGRTRSRPKAMMRNYHVCG